MQTLSQHNQFITNTHTVHSCSQSSELRASSSWQEGLRVHSSKTLLNIRRRQVFEAGAKRLRLRWPWQTEFLKHILDRSRELIPAVRSRHRQDVYTESLCGYKGLIPQSPWDLCFKRRSPTTERNHHLTLEVEPSTFTALRPFSWLRWESKTNTNPDSVQSGCLDTGVHLCQMLHHMQAATVAHVHNHKVNLINSFSSSECLTVVWSIL